MQRGQVGQTAKAEHPQKGIRHRNATGLPGRSRRPASSISPRSISLDTVEEESTPRTCSMKLRLTGWL